MEEIKAQRAVVRSPRDSSYSGCRIRCKKCGIVKLTVGEFRTQSNGKADQVWLCPRCGSVGEFRP